MPRKPREDVIRIAQPKSMDALTMTGPKEFGIICLKSILKSLAPTHLAASTKPASRIESTCPLIRRAYHGHHVMLIANIALFNPGPRAADSAIARTKEGKARTRSVNRIIISSTAPPT
ncbi:hypothetical protein ES703_71762 [subsurface metagenome]